MAARSCSGRPSSSTRPTSTSSTSSTEAPSLRLVPELGGRAGRASGPMRSRHWHGGLALLASLAALGGCAIPDNFVDRAVSYNRALEQAENETLLLNILRAANERPLYFTNFSAIRGSMSASVGLGALGSA